MRKAGLVTLGEQRENHVLHSYLNHRIKVPYISVLREVILVVVNGIGTVS